MSTPTPPKVFCITNGVKSIFGTHEVHIPVAHCAPSVEAAIRQVSPNSGSSRHNAGGVDWRSRVLRQEDVSDITIALEALGFTQVKSIHEPNTPMKG